MEKNNSVYFNQSAIENAFKNAKQRGNYFIEFNRSVVIEACKNSKDTDATLIDRLNEIQVVIDNKQPLSIDQYTLLGSFAYFYGMDFCGQGFLHLNIAEFVEERFAKLFDGYEFSALEISALYNIFLSVQEINLIEPKDNMKSGILDVIKLDKEADNVLKTVIIPGLKSIVGSAIIPINLAKEVTDLKAGEITYQAISKYNLLINQDCNILGKSIKQYCKVYSEPVYNQLLNECLLREEKTKFSMMYLDSIISLQEAINRMELSPKDFVNLTINIDELKDLYDFADAESKFNEKFKSEEVEESNPDESNEPVNYVPKISNEELNEKFATSPDLVVAAYLEEIAKSNVLTKETILSIADKLVSDGNDELLQHIYQYMTTNLKTKFDSVDYYPCIEYSELFEVLDNEIKTAQDEYREIAEFICQPIPDDKVNRVVTYVNDIISCLVLTDTQQKQYLISQFAENSISTYNQLQQIVSLIENAKIFGSDAITYTTLYNYLNDNDNFTEVFDKATGLSVLENKISLLTKLKEWFGRYYTTGETPETDETPNKPKMEILK